MAENRAPNGSRHVFLEGAPARLAGVPSALTSVDHRVERPTSGLPSAPGRPLAGSRRKKGGSFWLAEQERLRAERVAESAVGTEAKHCWVLDDPRWPGRHAALLLGWVRDESGSPGGWAGRVAFMPGTDLELVVAMVPASHLRAAG